MKKYFLAIATLIVGLTASADIAQVNKRIQPTPEVAAKFNSVEATSLIKPDAVQSRADGADDEVYYTLAGDPYTALSFTSQTPGMQVAMAFQIDPEFLKTLTDGQITEVSYWTGTQTDEQVNKITKYTVFIASALDGTYLYTQESIAPTTAFTKVDVKLNEPFTIPADTKIYVGVYFNINSENNAAVVVDYLNHSNVRGGWIATRASSLAKWSWDNYASQVGFVTLGAKIKSSTLPKNEVEVVQVSGQPVVGQNTPFEFFFELLNTGANDVQNVEVEYGIEGEQKVTNTFNINGTWGMNQSVSAKITDFKALQPTKGSDVTIKVISVNGQPNNAEKSSGSYSVISVPEGKGLQQNVVIEEFTSISCQYCPVGYTSMEKIHEETDGTIIPVCIHINSPGSDPMTALSYNSVVSRYCTGGVPSAIINRSYDAYPLYDELMETVNAVKSLPGYGMVSAQAALDQETRILTVNTKTSFAFDYEDGDQNFILCYAVTEDNVGPYNQNNGYAGAGSEIYGGWQDQAAKVSLIYNDVARQLDKFAGIAGSIPAEIKAGEEYAYSHDVKVLQTIKKLEDINVVVYLLNVKTGAVVNACMIKSAGIDAGVDAVAADSDNSNAPVEYFNLQGIRVNNPSNGIFIRRQGSKVTKELIK